MTISRYIAVTALLAGLAGCGAPPPPGSGPGGPNIAQNVLPGSWQVVGETVYFTFDENGYPVAIANSADPEDWRTNFTFGEPTRLDAPIGGLDIVFEPGEPYINPDTGEASFSAYGTGSNIVVGGVPIIGTGYATFEWTGQYVAESDQLVGAGVYTIFYGGVPVYTDEVSNYVLQKIP